MQPDPNNYHNIEHMKAYETNYRFGASRKCTLFIALLITTCSQANLSCTGEGKTVEDLVKLEEDDDARLDWWRNARFGMFIHWGPVSLKGTEIGWSRGEQVPVEEYDNLYRHFNPVMFDAAEWVSLAKDAGMKYIVLTAKHHDGFCLWDTETTSYNIMSTPFGRNVVQELSDECKRQGIVFSTYYSILDWYHPDYNTSGSHGGPGYPLPEGQRPDMDRYVEYMTTHLRELITNYGPLGILWFDGEWEESWTHGRGLALYEYVRGLQPNIIINNRVDKGRRGMAGVTLTDQVYAGDYDTPEQQIGNFQIDRPWETCMTLCTQWAWKPDDTLKSLKEGLHTLVQTAGGDGNLLLNVGPMPDGRIEPRQADRLREMGAWLERYGESIYETRGGPFEPGPWGASTHNGKRVYIHVLDWPADTIVLPALRQRIIASGMLTGGEVTVKQTRSSIEISVPVTDRDSIDTIVFLGLDESILPAN